MKFGHVVVYVQDVLKTIDFYKRAFGFELKFIDKKNEYAEVVSGSTVLAFVTEEFARLQVDKFAVSRPKNDPLGFEIAMVSDDIEADFKRAIAAGAEKILEPSNTPWGMKMSKVRDLNGVLVLIWTKID